MSLEPDILLPDQLGGLTAARKPLQGARLLMLAVLQDALECYRRYRGMHDPASRLLFEETRLWVESTDRATFSFESICDVLDIDPDYLRRCLREQREPPPGGRRA